VIAGAHAELARTPQQWQGRAIHGGLLVRQGQLPAEVPDHADDLVPLLASGAVDLTAHDADALTDRVAAAEHVARK
jgi:hypothetical protein